jgi:hypothetical protein
MPPIKRGGNVFSCNNQAQKDSLPSCSPPPPDLSILTTPLSVTSWSSELFCVHCKNIFNSQANFHGCTEFRDNVAQYSSQIFLKSRTVPYFLQHVTNAEYPVSIHLLHLNADWRPRISSVYGVNQDRRMLDKMSTWCSSSWLKRRVNF